MANTIQLKRKTTAGPPLLNQLLVGEICLVIPDSSFYWKKDASTLVGPYLVVSGGSGDMQKSTYDANNDGVVDLATNATQLGGTNAASYALQSWVTSQINALVSAAPGALDTLKEFADALGNDANFSATITTALGNKLDASSTIDGGVIS